MKLIGTLLALACLAGASFADCGVIAPGTDVRFGNVHVANLQGARGNVNYCDNGRTLVLVVHANAFCAVLKNGTRPQARDIQTIVLGDGYYAQGNVSGAYVAVLGDNAVALSLALRGRHRNNANTIELMGNGNIAAAVRWFYGRGEVLMNKIRFGASSLFTGSLNDAYISGDREGTFDLLWANRTVDVAGQGNETIAFDGFPPPRDEPTIDEVPADVARDASELRNDSPKKAAALDRG